MTAIQDILESLPIGQIAEQVGASPEAVTQAAGAILPALLGGLQANAQDPSGAGSLLRALGGHTEDLLDGGVDLDQLNLDDGSAIAGHIFGDNEDAVVSQLGGLSSADVGGGLVKKLMPMLAPLVLAWLAKRVLGGGTAGAQSLPEPTAPATPAGSGGAGGLDDLLKDVLGGALGGALGGGAQAPAPAPGGMNAGSIITDILGGLLGGGRR